MLDEVLYLTPDAEDAPEVDGNEWPLPATNPPIMIPGIAADDSLYPIEKIEAHVRGLHHLALSVFVFSKNDDGELELLIQRRAFEKYHCGGQWANTCCTHPHFGEEAKPAASRRLTEELGFTVPIHEQRIVEYSADVGGGLWERERVHMFRADVERSDVVLDLNPEEVCEARWISADNLKAEMRDKPGDFTPWFRIYLNRYPNLDF